MYGPRPSQKEDKPLYAHLSEEEAKRLREQRFRAWLRRKDLHERTIEVKQHAPWIGLQTVLVRGKRCLKNDVCGTCVCLGTGAGGVGSRACKQR